MTSRSCETDGWGFFPTQIGSMMRSMTRARDTIVGEALPNLPWEERPSDCGEVVWRYSANPVIPRDLIPCANSIFNSAVVPYQGSFAGVFRVDDRTRNLTAAVAFTVSIAGPRS